MDIVNQPILECHESNTEKVVLEIYWFLICFFCLWCHQAYNDSFSFNCPLVLIYYLILIFWRITYCSISQVYCFEHWCTSIFIHSCQLWNMTRYLWMWQEILGADLVIFVLTASLPGSSYPSIKWWKPLSDDKLVIIVPPPMIQEIKPFNSCDPGIKAFLF